MTLSSEAVTCSQSGACFVQVRKAAIWCCGKVRYCSPLLCLVQVSTCMDKADLKAVDLQQLFLAMTEEVRIIVVKLADRLHNMRTLGSMLPEKQQKIANETLQVGMYLVEGGQHASQPAENLK